MKRKIPTSLYPIIVLTVFIGAMFVEFNNAHNMAVDYETRIDAQWQNNMNTLSQYNLKVQEAVQIPAMYRDDFLKTLNASMAGRYGKQGSQATMQWFKEHSITLPTQLYLKLQQIIEAGRNEFRNEQTKLLDLTRGYKRSSNSLWTGFMMRIGGFPSTDFNWEKYEVLIDSETENSFKEKSIKPIQLR
jgi:hypothetical protein